MRKLFVVALITFVVGCSSAPYNLFSQETDASIIDYVMEIRTSTSRPVDFTATDGDTLEISWGGAELPFLKYGWNAGNFVDTVIIINNASLWTTGEAITKESITLPVGYYQMAIYKRGDPDYYKDPTSDYSNRIDMRVMDADRPTANFYLIITVK